MLVQSFVLLFQSTAHSFNRRWTGDISNEFSGHPLFIQWQTMAHSEHKWCKLIRFDRYLTQLSIQLIGVIVYWFLIRSRGRGRRLIYYLLSAYINTKKYINKEPSFIDFNICALYSPLWWSKCRGRILCHTTKNVFLTINTNVNCFTDAMTGTPLDMKCNITLDNDLLSKPRKMASCKHIRGISFFKQIWCLLPTFLCF